MWDRCEIPILSVAHTLTTELLYSRRPSITGEDKQSECCDKQTHNEFSFLNEVISLKMYVFLPCCKLSGSSVGGIENSLVLVQMKYMLNKCIEFRENK